MGESWQKNNRALEGSPLERGVRDRFVQELVFEPQRTTKTLRDEEHLPRCRSPFERPMSVRNIGERDFTIDPDIQLPLSHPSE